jgi:hypothetical protein
MTVRTLWRPYVFPSGRRTNIPVAVCSCPLRRGPLGGVCALCGDAIPSEAERRPPNHQSQLAPADNKFHKGNGEDAKHYWLTPPDLYDALNAEFRFDFDPCPYPKPEGFDGLSCEWGQSNYVNPPFGSIMHEGKKKGPTAWVRKAIEEWQKGKRVVLVYPIDKWVLMLMKAILGDHAQVRNLGDVRWLATEDRSQGKGTGRHIACFILEPVKT